MKHQIFAFLATLLVAIFAATIQEAHEQLDILINTSTEHAESGLRKLNLLSSDIYNISEEVVFKGKLQIVSEATRIEHIYTEIYESAQKLGVNITSCMKSKELMREILDLSQLSLDACVNRFSYQANGGIEKCYLELNSVMADIFPLRNELQLCKESDKKCVNDVYDKIKFAEIDIPRRMTESIDMGENKVEVNKLLLQECGVKETEGFLVQSSKVIETIQKCVDKLIEG